ncbi:hypothetical protein GWN42_31220 [candidate division KSB1 bacterium]|nr:hypothetical protein [Phycisphaerae bacterium]NIQ92530.1 hypothetical protein [Deltaproteobacteria bacterium]NIV97140.1 hypothetical protein [candidate division KSB1 bacterium]
MIIIDEEFLNNNQIEYRIEAGYVIFGDYVDFTSYKNAEFGDVAEFGDGAKYRGIEFRKLISMSNIDGSGRGVNIISSINSEFYIEAGCFFGSIDDLSEHMRQNGDIETKPYYIPVLRGVIAGISEGNNHALSAAQKTIEEEEK